MNGLAITCLGWLATATFVASYFFARAAGLRTVQMLGALLWMLYGALIGAPPVIVANLLVMAAAAWGSVRESRRGRLRPPALSSAYAGEGSPSSHPQSNRHQR